MFALSFDAPPKNVLLNSSEPKTESKIEINIVLKITIVWHFGFELKNNTYVVYTHYSFTSTTSNHIWLFVPLKKSSIPWNHRCWSRQAMRGWLQTQAIAEHYNTWPGCHLWWKCQELVSKLSGQVFFGGVESDDDIWPIKMVPDIFCHP